MHAYATDAKDGKIIYTYLSLAALAFLVAFFIFEILKLKFPWWVDAPSVMGFYGIFYALYDNYVWKAKLGPLKFSMLPDLNGTWAGIIKSSHDKNLETPATLHINQTWSKICVKLETDKSKSFSTMAALNKSNSLESGLNYAYLNEPSNLAVETMASHRGTAHLDISEDKKQLVGGYYSGRDRQTIGELNFFFISKQRLDHKKALEILKKEGKII